MNNMAAEVIASLVTAIVAIIVAIGTTLLNFYQFKSSRKDQVENELNRILFDSLKWFEGGTQKRSIGIAIIEGYWYQKKEKLENVWKPLLINQAHHILEESKEKDKSTEISNLKRIVKLLGKATLLDDEKNLLIGAINSVRTELSGIEEDKQKGIILDKEIKTDLLNILGVVKDLKT